jgi:hypothetical protein
MKKIAIVVMFFVTCMAYTQQLSTFAGTYTTSISEADVPPEGKDLVGIWEIMLSEQNQFTASKSGEIQSRGTYLVQNDHVSFADQDGPNACPKEQAAGTYQVSYDVDTVTFTAVDDQCAGRKIILSSHALTRTKALNEL